MNIPIQAIMKYIMSVYKPDDIQISRDYLDTMLQIRLTLFFKEIDDSYLRNPMARSTYKNKEDNLEMRIRKDLETFFSVKTTGLHVQGSGNNLFISAPYIVGDIQIEVVSDRSKE